MKALSYILDIKKKCSHFGASFLHPSLIHRHIRESIRFFIGFSIDMDEADISSPFGYRFFYVSCQFFEFCIFDLVLSGELLHEEFTICSELHHIRTELDRSSDTEKCCGIFGDIIGRMTDIFVSFFERFSLSISDIYPATRWSGISTGTSVSIDDKFHKKNKHEHRQKTHMIF